MSEFFRGLFQSDIYMPHGSCMLWQPGLVWLHAFSDITMGLAYYSIPIAIVAFVRRRHDLAYRWAFLMFGLFIFACGTTHFLEAFTLWQPIYRFEGLIKAFTAAVSVAAAVALWPLIPRALALPSMATLRQTNAELGRRRDELEAIIDERTQALKRINQQLLRENAERRQTQLELAQALEAAEQAGRAKTQFLANMSHELRTPLNAIIGFSEVLEDHTFGPLNERQTRYVRNILTSGRDLLQLINDVLDLSKIEAGRMDLEPEPFNPRDALNDIHKVVRATASKKQIDLTIETPDNLPAIVADQSKFKQIMYNLLSNAVKFTPQGGSVRVCAEVVAEAAADPNLSNVPMPCLKVTVADTGIGIPPEAHDRVFLEFEQLDSSFQRMHEGSGLGLALTRKLVELHGGRIWLESEGLGKGTTFYFALPLSPSSASPLDTECPPRQVRILGPGSEEPHEYDPADEDPIVLVVEDDPHARELLTHYLCSAGYRVAHARDGEEAVRVAATIKPAAITLDVLLPRRDGWEVLRELKASPETEAIPVIVVSITKDARLGFSLGAVDYLVKPVDREKLLNSLRRISPGSGKPGLSVLVVDDDPETVEILSNVLRTEGHHVLASYGGRHGAELAIQYQPDAIVLDLNMPDMSGFDVIQRLREHPRARRIPVIVFTAMDLSPEERSRLSDRIRALVPKSAREYLLQTLADLRRKRGRAADGGDGQAQRDATAETAGKNHP